MLLGTVISISSNRRVVCLIADSVIPLVQEMPTNGNILLTVTLARAVIDNRLTPMTFMTTWCLTKSTNGPRSDKELLVEVLEQTSLVIRCCFVYHLVVLLSKNFILLIIYHVVMYIYC